MNSQVVEKVSLVREDENISYITPTRNPLSCTVVIVETGHNIWLMIQEAILIYRQ